MMTKLKKENENDKSIIIAFVWNIDFQRETNETLTGVNGK